MKTRARFAEVSIRALLSKRGPDDDDDDDDDDDLFSAEADANSLDDMAARATKGLRGPDRGGSNLVRAKLKRDGGPRTEYPVAPKVKLKLPTQTYEVAPPGMEPVVKALKRKKGITNPFAVAWSMHNKAKRKRASEAAAWWLFRRGYAGPLINRRAVEVFLVRQGFDALNEFQAFLEQVEAAPVSVGAALVRPGARPVATMKDPQGHMSTVAVPKKAFRNDLQRKLRLRKVMQPERPGSKPPKAQGVGPGKVA